MILATVPTCYACTVPAADTTCLDYAAARLPKPQEKYPLLEYVPESQWRGPVGESIVPDRNQHQLSCRLVRTEYLESSVHAQARSRGGASRAIVSQYTASRLQCRGQGRG